MPDVAHRRRQQMRQRDHRHRELGAQAKDEERREETADPEADDRGGAAREHTDGEERQEEG